MSGDPESEVDVMIGCDFGFPSLMKREFLGMQEEQRAENLVARGKSRAETDQMLRDHVSSS